MASTAIPTTVLIKLARATTTSKSTRVSFPHGTADIASTPNAESAVEITYQRLGESVISTAGAQSHFSQLTSNWEPMIKEPSVIDSPCWVAKNVSATETNPPSAPN